MNVKRYGLHWAPGDIAFLVQAGGGVNVFSSDLPSPFSIANRIRCPHAIDLDAVVEPPAWVDHPTAAYFMPTPRRPGEKPRLLYDPDGTYEAQINALKRLSSPTITTHWPIWAPTRAVWNTTNLGPLVWGGVEIQHTRAVWQQIDLGNTHNRRLVFISRNRIPLLGLAEPLVMEGLPDLSLEPMEAIGAGQLRLHMETSHG